MLLPRKAQIVSPTDVTSVLRPHSDGGGQRRQVGGQLRERERGFGLVRVGLPAAKFHPAFLPHALLLALPVLFFISL
jgi:hypothetical protein